MFEPSALKQLIQKFNGSNIVQANWFSIDVNLYELIKVTYISNGTRLALVIFESKSRFTAIARAYMRWREQLKVFK